MIGGVFKSSVSSWNKYAHNEDLKQRKIAKIHKSKEKDYGDQI